MSTGILDHQTDNAAIPTSSLWKTLWSILNLGTHLVLKVEMPMDPAFITIHADVPSSPLRKYHIFAKHFLSLIAFAIASHCLAFLLYKIPTVQLAHCVGMNKKYIYCADFQIGQKLVCSTNDNIRKNLHNSQFKQIFHWQQQQLCVLQTLLSCKCFIFL